MAKNVHKYYLAIDDKPIFFPDSFEYPDMTSFLSLCLFTGIFEDKNKLLKGLSSLFGIEVDDDDLVSVSIVKSKNVGNDVLYNLVTYNLLYREAVGYLSQKCIREFLFENRRKFPFMRKFLGDYLEETEKMISYFENTIDKLKKDKQITQSAREKKKIDAKISSKENSLKNFLSYRANIKVMLDLIDTMSINNGYYESEMDNEFVDRLSRFITNEIFYVRGEKRTVNYRGFIKLVEKMVSFWQCYPEVAIPYKDNKFLSEQRKMLLCFRNAVKRRLSPIRNNDEDIEESSFLGDPDSFMFLEAADFEALLKDSQGKEIQESVQVDIENLHNLQGKKL